MEGFLVIILLLTLLTETFSMFVNREELNVALDVMKKFEIHDGVFIVDDQRIKSSDVRKIVPYAKMMSSRNIITGFWDLHRYHFYLKRNENHYHKRAFIMKNHSLVTKKCSKYVWLVFHNQIHDQIPYDCEYIGIRKYSSNAYGLVELYKVNNRIAWNDFGKWDKNSGLMIQDASMYWRRLNLNYSVINSCAFDSVHPDVSSTIFLNFEID